jgi:uncharacterized protein (TIGR03083 family)
MGELGDAYHGVRMRVTDLVTAAGDGASRQVAPATPDWTVKDNLAHLAGVTADILRGNLDGVGTTRWADAQVEARRNVDVTALLTEWDTCASTVETMVDQFGKSGAQLVTDAATHEHDIRGGMGQPGARDSDAVEIAFAFVGAAVGEALDATDRGALLVAHDAGTVTFGSGAPTVTLRTTRFEFLRAATGRRCRAQIAAYDWDGAAPTLDLVLARFTARADPLEE